MKILLLEDDLILNEIIEEHLMAQNFDVQNCFDGIHAQELLYANTYDLLLFDVNVPNINGFELLENLRENKIMTPTIFITSLDMVEDVEKGFDAGCDDYIKKPFALKELDLRISNIKRLNKIEDKSIVKIDENIFVDFKNLIINKENERISMTSKEFDVLNYLIKNEGNTVSIEELSSNVWSYEESPSDSTVRTYIKNLRRALGDEFIVNTRGVGYRFNKK